MLLNRQVSRSVSVPAPTTVAAIKYWVAAWAITGATDGGALATTDIVDQSQSALGALQTRVALTYRSNAGTGTPAIEFNGSTSYGRSPSFTVSQPCRVFAVVKQIAWANDKRMWDRWTVNGGAIAQKTVGGTLGLYAGSAYTSLNATGGYSQLQMLEVLYNGASSQITIDGLAGSTGNPGSVGYTDGMILGGAGGALGGFFANFQLCELMVVDNTASSDDLAAIRAWLNYKHALPLTHTSEKLLLCDGNSLSAGDGATAGSTDYPTQLHALLGGTSTCRLRNFGVSGQTVTQMAADYSTQVAPFATGWQKSILVMWEITNDIFISGANGTTAYNNTVSYCNTARASGFKVVVMTCIARGQAGWTAGMETARTTCNASIVSNWATFADGLVDLAADSRLSNASDTTYYNADKIHLNSTGYGVVAALANPVVAGLL